MRVVAAAEGPGSSRAPSSCRRRPGWWGAKVPRSHGRGSCWDGYCECGGPTGRLPWYLNSVSRSALCLALARVLCGH